VVQPAMSWKDQTATVNPEGPPLDSFSGDHCDIIVISPWTVHHESWYIPKKNKAVVNLTPCLHGKKQWTLQQAMFDCERVANVVKPIANHPINYPWLGGIKNLIPVIGFFSGYTQCPKPLLGMVFLVIQFSHNYT
jgi:hypothetical protein